MQRDECLVVDEHDTLLRTANKHACHRFNQPDQPVAPLHRAFSVFLFRPEDNRLLLQQRAAAKVRAVRHSASKGRHGVLQQRAAAQVRAVQAGHRVCSVPVQAKEEARGAAALWLIDAEG